MCIRNAISLLKEEYTEAKINEGKLLASCLWHCGSRVPGYCVPGLEYQNWYMLTTLCEFSENCRLFFPLKIRLLEPEARFRNWKHLKAETFVLIRDAHRQSLSGKEFRLYIKGWLSNVMFLSWTMFILVHNLVRVPLHAEENTGTAHPWNMRLLWAGLFSGLD